MTHPARRMVVRGRVQGVGFRWFVREQAHEAGLAGWVRNQADGSVEILASGSPAALDALEGAVRRGPSGARVTDVEVETVPAPGALPNPFSVHR